MYAGLFVSAVLFVCKLFIQMYREIPSGIHKDVLYRINQLSNIHCVLVINVLISYLMIVFPSKVPPVSCIHQ